MVQPLLLLYAILTKTFWSIIIDHRMPTKILFLLNVSKKNVLCIYKLSNIYEEVLMFDIAMNTSFG